MLISYNGLMDLVADGVISGVNPDNVNGSSIDITLGNKLIAERKPSPCCPECGQSEFPIEDDFKSMASTALRYCNVCKKSSAQYQWMPVIDPAKKHQLSSYEIDITERPYALQPKENVLAHSTEVFNLPHNITAEYRLKSSMARVFLEHLHAGWCDPGWHGSVLTLEFANLNKYHSILLTNGMKCGQVCFYEHEPVPRDRSYEVRGSYNRDTSVAQSKGSK